MVKDAVKETIRKIEDGFVISEQGRWIYMAEQRIYERRVIDQVVNGNVLVDGKWVSIGEARRRGKAAAQSFPAKKPPVQAPPAPVTPLIPPNADIASFEAMGDMLETVCIDMAPAMAMAQAQAAAAEESRPSRVDSVVLLFNPTKNAAADRSRSAMEYIKRIKK